MGRVAVVVVVTVVVVVPGRTRQVRAEHLIARQRATLPRALETRRRLRQTRRAGQTRVQTERVILRLYSVR